jgi:hypothetical protein
MAKLTLELILRLVRNDPVSRMFMLGTLPTHSAHLCLHLLEQLIGENSQDIASCTDVKWRPGRILADIVGLLLILARDPSYVKVCTGHFRLFNVAFWPCDPPLRSPLPWCQHVIIAHDPA